MSSKGIHEELFELLGMIQDVCTTFGENADIWILLKGGTVLISPSDRAYASLLGALSRLAHRVISDWDDLDGWKGDMYLRLKSIVSLHRLVRQGHLDEKISSFVFHQFLLTAFGNHNRDCDRTSEDEHLIELLRNELRLSRSSTTRHEENFELFLAHISANRLLGLPIVVLDAMLPSLDELSDRRSHPKYGEVFVRSQLDGLFHQFLAQDPEKVDPEYPSTRHHQSHTLERLIEFARETGRKDILAPWRKLLHEERDRLDPIIELSRMVIKGHDASFADGEGSNGYYSVYSAVGLLDLAEAISMFEDQFSYWMVLEDALAAMEDTSGPDTGSSKAYLTHADASALFDEADGDPYPAPFVDVEESEIQGERDYDDSDRE